MECILGIDVRDLVKRGVRTKMLELETNYKVGGKLLKK